jgi:hypothetical protein
MPPVHAFRTAAGVLLLIFPTHNLPDALRRNIEIDSNIYECFALFEALSDQYISLSDR